MKKLIGPFVTLFFVLFLNTSKAGVLIEPQLGYIIGSTSTTALTNSTTGAAFNYSNSYNGPQYGARLGYQILGLMGGLSYNHASYTLKNTLECVGCSNNTYKSKRDDLGLFVGYNAPILLRAWLGYSFSVKETADETIANVTTTGSWNKGSATEIGVGFTGLPFLSLNLVYRMLTFTKSYNASSNVESSLSPNIKSKEVVLGVSAPFNLF